MLNMYHMFLILNITDAVTKKWSFKLEEYQNLGIKKIINFITL